MVHTGDVKRNFQHKISRLVVTKLN